MQATAIFFIIMLLPLTTKNSLSRSRNTWKSRNRLQFARTLHLHDTESRTYYLPRTFEDMVAFEESNSLSFEDVVKRLKESGILDLPSVSVIRMSNSSQSQNNALDSPAKLRVKRCSDNPCGGCPSAISTTSSFSVENVAKLKVKTIECNAFICFKGKGECKLIKRKFRLFGKKGNNWKEKTIKIPVGCACVKTSAG